jgi:copper chaperone
MQFHIDNMTCGGCARSVTAAIRSLDPGATVRADPPGRTVEVETVRGESELRAVLTAAGFPPR